MVFAFHPYSVGVDASFVCDAICASRRHLAQHLSQPEEILYGRAKLQSIPQSPSKTIGESREELITPRNSPPPTPAGSPEPGVSPTPRVVILPAASPAAESDQAIVNPPAKPEAVVKPEASPNLTPVLLSLPLPTPGGSPKILPSAAPGTGNATSN